MMRLIAIGVRLLFCAILLTLLLFCNRPEVQRGPEQDSVSNPIDMGNTLRSDSVSQPDTTINKPVDDSTRRP